MTTDKPSVRIFSARACAAPLEEAARLFTKQSGIEVRIDVCSRHCASAEAEEAHAQSMHEDFLDEIAQDGVYDLAIGGAEYLLDDGEVRGIVQPGQRRLIALRESAIVVPADNPAQIESLQDLTKPGVRIAISMIDCLKGLWEDVCGRARVIEGVMPNIKFRANGCVAIVEAVAQCKVDAAFGWAAFAHLDPDRIRVIEMPADQRVARGTGVALLTTASQPEAARPFMDFLATPEARACYVKCGWVLP